MNKKTIESLFRYYFGYWIVKLNLHKRYKFILKRDNRIDCLAQVMVKDSYLYEIRFNVKPRYKNAMIIDSRYKIISIVLHELGHILYDFRSAGDAKHEYVAEKFMLETVKKEYPNLYNRILNTTKEYILKKVCCEIHRTGFMNALKDMDELIVENNKAYVMYHGKKRKIPIILNKLKENIK